MVSVGQHVCLGPEVARVRLAKAREDVVKEHPEAKLRMSQAGGQVGDFLDLRIKLAERTPGPLRQAAGRRVLPLHDAMLAAHT